MGRWKCVEVTVCTCLADEYGVKHMDDLLNTKYTARLGSIELSLHECSERSIITKGNLCDLAQTANCLAQRMSELHELDLVPLKRLTRFLAGSRRAAIRFRQQDRTHQENHGSRGQNSARRAVGWPLGEVVLHATKPHSNERGRNGVQRSGERLCGTFFQSRAHVRRSSEGHRGAK